MEKNEKGKKLLQSYTPASAAKSVLKKLWILTWLYENISR